MRNLTIESKILLVGQSSSKLHILKRIPNPIELERQFQALTILTGILSWGLCEARVSFNSRWRKTARRAIIDNYQGDRAYVVFSLEGALLEGSVHDCSFANDQDRAESFRENIPYLLKPFVDHELILGGLVTFSAWSLAGETSWNSGCELPDPEEDLDGAESILSIAEFGPESFQAWAEENYEVDLDLRYIEQIYRNCILTEEVVSGLNPSLTLKKLESELTRIGCPWNRGKED